jgi:hypothetical protein
MVLSETIKKVLLAEMSVRMPENVAYIQEVLISS